MFPLPALPVQTVHDAQYPPDSYYCKPSSHKFKSITQDQTKTKHAWRCHF